MPVDHTTHGFVATLSNGATVAEHQSEWIIIEGERKPWVRLGDYLLKNKLYLTSLRYNGNGQTYHAPKLDTRFEKGGLHPDWYSLEYIFEHEEGASGASDTLLVDIGAYYGDMSMHTIIEIGGQRTVWTQVRKGHRAMAYVAGKEQAM